MILRRFREWLWSFLSDRCEVCHGQNGGVRGNENILIVDGREVVACDYCHAARSISGTVPEEERNHWLLLQDEGEDRE